MTTGHFTAYFASRELRPLALALSALLLLACAGERRRDSQIQTRPQGVSDECGGKLDLHLVNLIDHGVQWPGAAVSDGPNGLVQADLIVRTKTRNRRHVEEAILDAGGQYRTSVGSTITATLPLSAVERVCRHPQIKRITLGRQLHLLLDRSILDANVDNVWSGDPPLPQGYRGAGVVVGIVDSGIDFTHPDFIDPVAGTTRILALWDQTLTKNAVEIEPVDLFPFAAGTLGPEYRRCDIDSDSELTGTDQCSALGLSPAVPVRQVDDHGHGTHVAGIAAGNGNAPPGTYVGVASEADLIVVKVPGLGVDSDIVDAVNYIFQRAAQLGKAAVVNISMGARDGPHDGTDEFEIGLDDLTGAGKVIVVAAGNLSHNAGRHHATDTVQTGTCSQVEFKAVGGQAVPIDIWYEGSDEMEVRVISPGNVTVGPVSPTADYVYGQTFGDGYLALHHIDDVARLQLANQDWHATVLLTMNGVDPIITPDSIWTLEVCGTAVVNGTFHAWITSTCHDPTGLAGKFDKAPSGAERCSGPARDSIAAAKS